MKKANQYCAVCDQVKDTLFEIADCGHLFCKDCCVSYIRSQAQNFSKAKCLQEGCSATLNKSKPIYLTLDRATIQRIGNYELFEMLQNNKDAVACRAKDCSGYFLKTSKQPACNTCSALHCLKCLALVHSGACASNKQEEEEMRGLNYRKCPKCAVWVQKSGGCEFINCKCGVEFCFRCGQEYSKDPCRKREVWRKEKEIRQLMNSLKIVVPSDLASIFLLLLRALLLVAIIIPFTVLYCVVPLVVLGGLVIVLVFLFMPLVVFNGIAYGDCECRWLGYLLAVLFYPVLGALFALLAVFILLLYPFGRNKYHHGMYDPLDMLMCHMAVYYLKFVNLIVNCCQ